MLKMICLAGAALALTRPAYAQEEAADTAPPGETAAPAVGTSGEPLASPTPVESDDGGIDIPAIEFHGFLNQGYSVSSANRYGVSRSDEGSARFFDGGFNLTSQLTSKLRAGMQLVAFNWDLEPGFEARLDWGFLDYRLRDEIGVRIGRFRQSVGLYNEIWDVETARVAVFLPMSIYTPGYRPYSLSANGAELYGHFSLGAAGSIDYAAWGGVLEPPRLAGATFEIDWTLGGRLVYETPLPGLRIGSSFARSHLDGDILLGDTVTQQLIAAGAVGPDFDGSVGSRLPGFYILRIFAEFQRGDLTLAAEYQLVNLDQRSDQPDIVPNSKSRPEGGYILTAYRFTDWFAAGAYISMQYADALDRTTARDNAYTVDYALSTRFDVNRFLAFKVEGHYFEGTALLDPRLNSNIDVEKTAVLGVFRACLAF